MRRANAFSIIFLIVELGLFFGCPISMAFGYTVAGFVCLGLFVGIILVAIIVASVASKLNTKERRDAKFERERAKHEEEYRLAKERLAASRARMQEYDSEFAAIIVQKLDEIAKPRVKREAVAKLANVLMCVSEKEKSAESAKAIRNERNTDYVNSHSTMRTARSEQSGAKKPRRIQ